MNETNQVKKLFEIEPVKPTPFNDEEKVIEEESFKPLLQSKVIESIAYASGKIFKENILTDTGTIQSGDVEITMIEFSKLSGSLGMGASKLLLAGAIEFTALNHTGKGSREVKTKDVYLDLNEYASTCGYDTELKSNRDNTRKRVNTNLKYLFSVSCSWKEKPRGKKDSVDYEDIRLLQNKGIRKGKIHMRFTDDFAEYLIHRPMTQCALPLLTLDNKKPNAYSIGIKINTHFFMDSNRVRGTAQTLKVKTLLSVTNLPDIESQTVKKYGWRERIKDPFENNMEALVECGYLKYWRYSGKNGAELTDEEATNYNSYYDWANTNVFFEIKNAPADTERLEAKKEERKKALKAASKKKSKS